MSLPPGFWADFLPQAKAALFTIFGRQGLADAKVGQLDLQTNHYTVLFDGAAARYVDSVTSSISRTARTGRCRSILRDAR